VDDSFAVGYILFNLALVFSVKNLMEAFFIKRRGSVYVMWLSYLIYSVMLGFAFFMWNTPLINIILSLSLGFMVTLNYDSFMIKRLLVAPIVLLLLLIVEAFGYILYMQSGFNLIQHAGVVGYASPNIFIIVGIAYYALGFSVKKFFTHIKKDALYPPIYLVSYLIIALVSYAVIFLTSSHTNLSAATIASVVVAILGINVLSLFFLDRLSLAFEKRLESALYAQERDYYFAQSQLMQDSANKVRSIRHDMNFHLSTLRDLVTDNQAVTDYINSLIGDLSESEVHSSTGNIAFDSIVNYKLKNAKEDNIKLDISIFVPPKLNIEIADIVTILGNLLDNALDAVAKVDDKMIRLDIEFSKGNLYIKIDNSFDGKIKYADGKKKQIATLKSGDEHGHGLNSIRKSIEKYNGHIDITHDDVFSVGVLLFVEDK